MSKTSKIFLGILTFLPFVFFSLYIGIVFQFVREFMFYHRANPEDMFFQMWPAFIYIGLVVVGKIGLLIYYIIHAVNNKRIDSTERIVWILVFIFAGLIGFPIYWYLRIWREDNAVGTTLVQ